MNNPEIFIALGIAIVVIALTIYLLSKVCKALFAILCFIFKPVVWVFSLFSHDDKKAKPKGKLAHYKSLAEFAAVIESDPTAIDSNLHAIFTDLRDEIGSVYDEIADEFEKAVLAEPLTSLEKIANAKIKDKSKPMFSSIGELAFAVEDKTVKLDSAIRSILTDIYDYCDIFCCQSKHDADLSDVTYSLEQVIWPNGQSESQAEATSKRQARKEAAIKAKMK